MRKEIVAMPTSEGELIELIQENTVMIVASWEKEFKCTHEKYPHLLPLCKRRLTAMIEDMNHPTTHQLYYSELTTRAFSTLQTRLKKVINDYKHIR